MLDAEMFEESCLYKRMYLYLFNRITDALEYETVEEIKESLKKAQCETEEIYIEKQAEIPENEIYKLISDSETYIGLLDLLIKTEKEKPLEAQDETFIDEITDWINELKEDNEYLKSIKTKKQQWKKSAKVFFQNNKKPATANYELRFQLAVADFYFYSIILPFPRVLRVQNQLQ